MPIPVYIRTEANQTIYTARLVNSVILDPNLHHELAFVKAQLELNITNISVALGNNTFEYSLDSFITPKLVTLPDGYYNLSTLNDEIRAILIANGDPINTLFISSSLATGLLRLELATGVEARFLTSTLYNIIGFNNALYTVTSLGATPPVFSNLKSILVHCRETNRALRNNVSTSTRNYLERSNIIYNAILANVPASTLIEIEPFTPNYIPMNSAGTIEQLSVYFTDQDNNILNLGAESEIVLEIRSIKN